MPNVASHRTAIATALNTVTGLRPVQSEGLRPDKLHLPTCMVVMADDAAPMNLTLTDFLDHVDVILIYSLRGGITRGDRGLSDLYDDVVTALVSGVVGLTNITRRGYGELEVQGVDTIGAILRLEVIDQ